MKKIIVVGGVAGGASFAARMRRLDETAEIILLERSEHISFANCGLPYHIGETIKDRQNLIIQTPERFSKRFGVDVRVNSEAIFIDHEKNEIHIRKKNETYIEQYDYVVLSPGAEPIKPVFPGIELDGIYTLRTIPDMDRIKAQVDSRKAKHAVVIGGGFIGLEMAENLRHRGLQVSIVELTDQVFAPADKEMAAILHQHLLLNSIDLRLKDGVTGFVPVNENQIVVQLKSGANITTDMVVLAIGVKPDTNFVAKSGITVNERGAIIVDQKMRTNIPNIFAVGDAVEVTDFVSGVKTFVPLAGPANRQGRIVADVIAGLDRSYKATQGTSICKIFDLTAAVTGLNEKNAKRFNIPFKKSYTHSASHASYYPGSYPLSIKILFAPDTGKLLGAQVIGKIGVDKRIDVFATALRCGLTIDDLAELELSYAPPFGSAKDAINVAGMVAQNIKDSSMPVWYSEELPELLTNDNVTILDVRTKDEFAQGTIEKSVNIPVDELREKVSELDKSKPVYLFCQVGLRGNIATRILHQKGFTVKNLSGGYKTFQSYKDEMRPLEYTTPVTQATCSTPSAEPSKKKIVVDACGMQCPGPILKLKQAMDKLETGAELEIRATEQGFAADIPSWCSRTSNTLISLCNDNGVYSAVIRKGASQDTCKIPQENKAQKTMVIFSNDFDKMMAAFIIGNGAVSMGSEVTMFFTFWGLNLLRKGNSVPVKKNIIEKMFGMMMPRGAKKLTLSKMHMAGMGTLMIQQVMKYKKVLSLTDLIREAQNNGIKFVACSMSMDIMGIKKEELIDGVEIGGVAMYLERADKSGYNVFI